MDQSTSRKARDRANRLSATTQTFSLNRAPQTMKALSNEKRIQMERPKLLTDSHQAKDLHFRIEWRQLTYYKKHRSIFPKLCNKYSNENVDFTNIGYASNGSKRILNSLDGCFKSGELSAILGPSGAGKSTFLSTLFGSKHEGAYGQTKVTWFDANQQPLRERRPLKIEFLPQDDHLLHHLSVYETLMFASKIKNATRPNKAKNFHHQNVIRVAKMLKLVDCFHTRCNKLSGGQYKRVSIAQELLSEPDVIIFDEPTSGLDALTCLSTIQTLKKIVKKHPMSIILTIHQPDADVFNLFDHIYVIAQGGLAIYEGPPENVVPFLAEANLKIPSNFYNPARFIIENSFLAESPAQERKRAYQAIDCNESEEDEDDDDDDENKEPLDQADKSFLKRSVLSLVETIGGVDTMTKKDKKPLLNIGIQTSDGKLITSEQLVKNTEDLQNSERLCLLKKLNKMQKSRYLNDTISLYDNFSDRDQQECLSERQVSSPDHSLGRNREEDSSAKSDYSSSGWSERKTDEVQRSNQSSRIGKALSFAHLAESNLIDKKLLGRSMQTISNLPTSDHESILSEETVLAGNFSEVDSTSDGNSTTKSQQESKLKRQFDKRLSSKHNCSKHQNHPTFYHGMVLTHRTWLSISRDPIFFTIQAMLHTIIPVLLATISGSLQEEGCPQVGNFDLVDFAYSGSESMLSGAVMSIRHSVANIGIVFFEMFVLSFSINCITALIFPFDMHVLLKEYHNGWYSIYSYFLGRTLADLPVPIFLHSIAMTILCYLTGQPLSAWRFGLLLLVVVITSLIAQSFGLTIGALLMRSSQSAVLAAAALIAPIFALSGFIVRIYTLPKFVQLLAQGSYLHHLLNGFIILRYGYGRCECHPEDFEQNQSHQIPTNLQTMASVWIGTYSNEYPNSTVMIKTGDNRTNVDPNIDIVDKMMNAFKMANSYGHDIRTCDDAVPYAMLDFNLHDNDLYWSFFVLIVMLIVSRFITFMAIYYKVRAIA